MRRRQVRYVSPEPERHTALFIAAGAIAGAAAGMYLGRRYRTLDAFIEDVRDRLEDVRTAWDDALDHEEEGLLPDHRDDESESDEAGYDEEDWDAAYDVAGAQLDDDLVEDEDDEDEDDVFNDLDALTSNNGVDHGDVASERARLETRVLEALHDDRRLRSRAIEIAAVGDGVIELTGSVHAIEEISRAASLVRKVPGVAMVLNRIEVRAPGSVASPDSSATESADSPMESPPS